MWEIIVGFLVAGSSGQDGCENAAAYVACAKKAFFEGGEFCSENLTLFC